MYFATNVWQFEDIHSKFSMKYSQQPVLRRIQRNSYETIIIASLVLLYVVILPQTQVF